MPMYEYGCQACSTRFDRLRRMDQDDADVTCPRCSSGHVQRRLSTFAAHSRDGAGVSAAATAPVAASGGGCCGGSCCSGGTRAA
jgi:putative FmdB family regulatory protein